VVEPVVLPLDWGEARAYSRPASRTKGSKSRAMNRGPLRDVIRARLPRVGLSGSLYDDLDIGLGREFADLPVHDGPAEVVQDGAQSRIQKSRGMRPLCPPSSPQRLFRLGYLLGRSRIQGAKHFWDR